MLRSRKAQAILELAILGSLVIMAFAVVISTSENYNRRQSYMQQTFRATLNAAWDTNDAGSVSTIDHRRMPNVTNPMEIGALVEFSGNNNILWSDGKKKNGDFTKSKQYFQNERGGNQLIITGDSGVTPGSSDISGSGYTSNLDSGNIYDKNETGDIHTNKTLDAKDNVGGWATVGDQTVGTGGYLGTGGKYTYPAGSKLLRNTKDVQE